MWRIMSEYVRMYVCGSFVKISGHSHIVPLDSKGAKVAVKHLLPPRGRYGHLFIYLYPGVNIYYYVCEDTVWGHHMRIICKRIHVWGFLQEDSCMKIHVWRSMFEDSWMNVHVWLWGLIDEDSCLSSHVWWFMHGGGGFIMRIQILELMFGDKPRGSM